LRGDKGQAAVFLDRDGTINEEVEYLDRLEKLTLIPGAGEAIRLLNDSGLKALVVTNQSGIARGFFDESFVVALHTRLNALLRREGAFLDGIYYCPHHPTVGLLPYLCICDCRKPAPGLLNRARTELNLDFSCSYMVGDTLSDIEAGARAGVPGILVRTGHGERTAALLGQDNPLPPAGTAATRPVYIAADLLEAARWIVTKGKP